MPKAYPDDEEEYEAEIEDLKTALEIEVVQSKWIVDLYALLAMSIAINALLVLLVKRAFETGLTLRLSLGLCVATMLAWWLFIPAWQAVDEASHASLLRVRALLHIPFDWQDRDVISRAIWIALRKAIQISAIMGTSLAFAELIKMSAVP